MRKVQTICLSLLLFTNMCGKKDPDTNKAKVIVYENDHFEHKEVEFKYLTSFKKMQSPLFTFYGGTELDANIQEDVIHSDPNKLFVKKGNKVKIDYYIENGTVIGKNFDSIAMLSIAYSFEQIYDFWGQYGFTHSDLGHANIYYNTKFVSKKKSRRITVTERLNAAYLNGYGDFLIFKSSDIEELPLKANIGVLAHEMGHLIFDLQFYQREMNFKEYGSLRSKTQISGMNEGWADFSSWLLTRKESLLFTESLNTPSFQERRIPAAWTSSQLLNNLDLCHGTLIYCKGSILTSALYELSTTFTMSPEIVTQATLTSLRDLREDWKNIANGEKFDYYNLLNHIVRNLPQTKRVLACHIFRKWFDDSLNKEGLDTVCPT